MCFLLVARWQPKGYISSPRRRYICPNEFLDLYELVTHIVSVAECFFDLAYVVDSSGSINFKGPNNWNTTLQFIANVTSQFNIGPNDVQVAFVLFSYDATVEWGLTRYQDKATLTNAILNVNYIGSATNLNDAIYLTRTQVFAPGRGTRANAGKAALILTDGEDNIPEIGTPLTIQNATLAKNEGIRLVAIGISDSVDRDRLLQIVSAPDDYYAVQDFSALQSLTAKLSPTEICNPTSSTLPPTTPGPSTAQIIAYFTYVRHLL